MCDLSNVRVSSDGLPSNTVVTVNGVPVKGVLGITWEMPSVEHLGKLTLVIEGAEVEVDALRVLINGVDED